MKQGIHPAYGPVAFRDRGTGQVFVTRSTLAGQDTGRSITVDGTTYPLIDVDVSSASHPFWTGHQRTIDSEGRVQAFERRYGRRK